MQKMVYSPDYLGVDRYQALEDFKARIAKYEEVYETITNRDLHYIKLIDMYDGGMTSHQNDSSIVYHCSLLHNAKINALKHPLQGDWTRVHGRQSHFRLHSWQNCVFPYAGVCGFGNGLKLACRRVLRPSNLLFYHPKKHTCM